MIALIQRVNHASVTIDGRCCAAIDRGVLAFIGIEKPDTPAVAEALVERLLSYRIFADAEGRMNRSVRDVQGGLLLVSQFTLAADTRRGLRPSFSSAMPPDQAATLYARLVEIAREKHPEVGSGEFGADMQVALENDGPVTFLLELPAPVDR